MSPLEAKEYGLIDHIIGGEEVSRKLSRQAGRQAKGRQASRQLPVLQDRPACSAAWAAACKQACATLHNFKACYAMQRIALRSASLNVLHLQPCELLHEHDGCHVRGHAPAPLTPPRCTT